MAPDAAFALGALVLFGKRIPTGLKVFLVALAIVDDICAIILIAMFYTENLQLNMLWIAAVPAGALFLINRLGIRHPLPYLAVSIGLWYAVLLSGVHATIAGVLAALAIPAHPRLHRWFLACKLREAAKATDKIDPQKPQNQILADEEKHELLESVEQRAKATRTPLRSWESAMERPVSLLVVPIFAFLNAGIVLSAEMFRAMALSPMSWGVIAGLVISKPLGIVFMSWLALKVGWGGLPEEVGLAHLLGLGLLWPAWASPCRYLSPSSASTISWSF
jgi:NhaA family Na+:H+ antiporter